MTSSPPPDPRSSQGTPLGFDEFIGVFVAFTTIGAIFFWSLSGDKGLQLNDLLSPSPSAQPNSRATPDLTANPTPLLPAPTSEQQEERE